MVVPARSVARPGVGRRRRTVAMKTRAGPGGPSLPIPETKSRLVARDFGRLSGMVQTRVTLGGVKPRGLLAERPCPDIVWGGNSTAAPRKKCYPGSEPFEPGRLSPQDDVFSGRNRPSWRAISRVPADPGREEANLGNKLLDRNTQYDNDLRRKPPKKIAGILDRGEEKDRIGVQGVGDLGILETVMHSLALARRRCPPSRPDPHRR
jgi:hypothetical protein